MSGLKLKRTDPCLLLLDKHLDTAVYRQRLSTSSPWPINAATRVGRYMATFPNDHRYGEHLNAANANEAAMRVSK
jgi:hypothetical protein